MTSPPDDRLLAIRISDLNRELQQLETALGNAAIEPALRERVWRRFETEIRKHRRTANDLELKLAQGGVAHDLWAQLRTLRTDQNLLVREFLAFLHGALVRSAGLDGGVCTITDAVLDDLSNRTGLEWRGFTVLASEGESYVDLAELVRLRFPAVSIWSVPFAVHEFGHLAGPLLSERLPDGQRSYRFKEYHARVAATDARGARHVHELFADAFATFTIGPAYACACVMLRFDPSEAFVVGGRHPSADSRINSIFQLLDGLDSRNNIMRLYTGMIGTLRRIWETTVATTARHPADKNIASGDVRLEELLDLLNRLLPSDALYAGWLHSSELTSQLAPDSRVELRLKPNHTLLDVLNAAWMCRLSDLQMDARSLRIIEERATALCSQRLRQTVAQRRVQ